MRPRRWQQKLSKKYFKVLPWFQPFDNESRIDFKGLFKDIVPELKLDKAMGKQEIYSGLVMHAGYQLLNDGGMWMCVGHNLKKYFKDVGEWDEAQHGVQVPFLKAVTKEGEARRKKDRYERAVKTRKKNQK